VSSRRVRTVWIDVLVVSACSLVFATTLFSQPRRPPAGPPTAREIQALADDLGVTSDLLRHAAEVVPPPARGMRPSPLQRDEAKLALASVLNVPVSRLDDVMRRHRSPPRD
jgi:hypothetical protein